MLSRRAVASVPASSAAPFFLRPYRAFWLALSVAALAIAAGLFAPTRTARIALFVATLIEAAGFAWWVAFMWIRP